MAGESGYTVRMIPFPASDFRWYLLDASVRKVDWLTISDDDLEA